jgi:O-antigen/teichoic acid export membrane protein
MNKSFLLASCLQFFTQATSLLLTVLMARNLGADAFGVFIFAISFLAYINLFSDLGLTTQGVKDASASEVSFQYLMESIVTTKLLLSLTLFCVALMHTFFLQPGSLPEKVSIISILFISVINCFNMSWYFNTKGKYFWYFGPKLFLNCALVFYVAHSHFTLVQICVLFSLSEMIIALMHLWQIRRIERVSLLLTKLFQFDFRYIKRSLDTSVILITDFLLTSLVIIVPGFFGNYSEVTQLFIIQKLFFVFFAPLKNLVSLYFIPKISRMQKNTIEKDFRILIRKVILIALSISLLYAALLVLFIQPITRFVFDTEILTGYFVIIFALNFVIVCITLPIWLFRVAFQNQSIIDIKRPLKLLSCALIFTTGMFVVYAFIGVTAFLILNVVANSIWMIYLFFSLIKLYKANTNFQALNH